MSKKKTSIWLTSGVAALTVLALGTASLAGNEEVETSERPKDKSENKTATQKETPKKETKEDNAKADKVKEQIETQSRQAKELIEQDVPFSERIEENLYIVQDGDTLSDISLATGVPIETLREVNGIHSANDIQVGWKLAVTQDAIDQLNDEGSFPNIAKQAGTGQEGRYAYTAPSKVEAKTETNKPATPSKKSSPKAVTAINNAVQKETVKPAKGNSQKPETPASTKPVENIKEETVIDDKEEVIDSEEEVVTPPVNDGSNDVVEETPEQDGETTENEDIVEEEVIPGEADVPNEGIVEEETPGEPSTGIVDETEEVIPGTPESPDAPATPEIVRTTKTYSVTTPLSPAVEYRHDPQLPVGETRTVEGTAGSIVETYKQVLENGQVISDELVDSQTTPSSPTIVYHGTKTNDTVRVTKTRTLSTVIQPGQIVRENPELPVGETRVVQEGVAGSRVEIYNQVFENNVLISDELVDTKVTEATPEIVEVGTKEAAQEIVKRTDTVVKKELIAAPTEPIIEYSDELAKGQQEVKQTAKDGVKEITSEVYFENDVEVGRTVIGETVIEEPRQAIIVVGTKEAAQEPTVETQVITEEVETPAPETIIEYSTELAEGEEVIKQDAQSGISQIISEVTFKDGVEVDRVVLSETILQEAKAQIIVRGAETVEETTESITEQVAIAAPTEPIIEYSADLALGEEVVKQEAKDGVKEILIDIVYQNGVEVTRNVVGENVVEAPQAKVIVRGTKEDVVETDVQTERVDIAQPETIVRETNELHVGEESVIQEGRPGVKEVVTTTTYVNGVEQSVDTVDSVIQNAQATIIEVGTKDKVESVEEVETIAIEQPETITRETMDLERGQERVVQEGTPGEKQVITTITFTNGVESSRDVVEVVTKDATPRIVEVGMAPVTTSETVTNNVETELEAQVTYNPYVSKDATIVHNEGTPRIVEQVIEIIYKDGVEVDRKVVSETVVQEGTPAQIEQGTREGVDTADVPHMGLSEEEIYNRAKDLTLINYEYREFEMGGELATGTTSEIFTDRDIEAINHGDVIDEVLLNQYFIELVNEERASQGIAPLDLDPTLAKGADTRALELAEAGTIRPLDPFTGNAPVDEFGNPLTHYRPYNEETGEYESFYTAFEYRNDEPEYYVGENLAARTYSGNPYELNSEKALAETFFQQWKDSPGHYNNMMSDVYTGTWISVKVGSDVKFTDPLFENYYDSIIGVQILTIE